MDLFHLNLDKIVNNAYLVHFEIIALDAETTSFSDSPGPGESNPAFSAKKKKKRVVQG